NRNTPFIRPLEDQPIAFFQSSDRQLQVTQLIFLERIGACLIQNQLGFKLSQQPWDMRMHEIEVLLIADSSCKVKVEITLFLNRIEFFLMHRKREHGRVRLKDSRRAVPLV